MSNDSGKRIFFIPSLLKLKNVLLRIYPILLSSNSSSNLEANDA